MRQCCPRQGPKGGVAQPPDHRRRRRRLQRPRPSTAAQLPSSHSLASSLQLFLMSLHKLLDHTPARVQGILPPRLLGGAGGVPGAGGAAEGRAAGGEVEEAQVRSKDGGFPSADRREEESACLRACCASQRSVWGLLILRWHSTETKLCVLLTSSSSLPFLQLRCRLLVWGAATRSMWPLQRQRLKSRHPRWGAPPQTGTHVAYSLQLAAMQACCISQSPALHPLRPSNCQNPASRNPTARSCAG